MAAALDPMEQIQALLPGSRVSVSLLESDPAFMPWCAWIEWTDAKGRKDITVSGKTKTEALRALYEAAAEAGKVSS